MLPQFCTIYYHLDGAVTRVPNQDTGIAASAEQSGEAEFDGGIYRADVYWDTHGRVDIYLTER
ncbi:hypothetical protein CcrC1_gp348 [Caulobacter phage C1]|nr:hypothetical protein CcrC1_gp348 [Caulobacter phage C1]UTU08577.1 hypothetical protein CcrC2_gp349 [Caulobacter phage C2]UTU09093.1 hypothetical protein CcrJ4_gp344 [Caulobacter phage J4]UTU09651.1 hypothetical protein CcrBL47_gp366 [Caulobacter phage BL47]UTU10210.1 hypothetical protein CcrRB23_gp348 [Caulobacter phage RB23]WGN97244.1 hypothetical protein [Bertelyvirus sp.]